MSVVLQSGSQKIQTHQVPHYSGEKKSNQIDYKPVYNVPLFSYLIPRHLLSFATHCRVKHAVFGRKKIQKMLTCVKRDVRVHSLLHIQMAKNNTFETIIVSVLLFLKERSAAATSHIATFQFAVTSFLNLPHEATTASRKPSKPAMYIRETHIRCWEGYLLLFCSMLLGMSPESR